MALSAYDLLLAQVEALPDAPVEDEESARAVDLSETLARLRRHTAEAKKAHPSPQADYEAYFRDAVDGLRLPNFTGVEVALPHKRVHRNGAKNSLPPGKLLPRLLVRLVLVQRTRNVVGPIRLTSLYRDGDYNRAVGGVPNGQHPACTAIDEVPLRASVAELHAAHERLEGGRMSFTPEQAAVIRRVAKDFGASPYAGPLGREPFSATGVGFDWEGVYVRGGVGRYRTFVHRDLRGLRARWDG